MEVAMQKGYGIILNGYSSIGPNIAHEIGHLLGLPHTYFYDKNYGGEYKSESWQYKDHSFSAMAMMPFEDDTKYLDNDDKISKNPMSYLWDPDDFNVEDFEWTQNQFLRSRLTIFSRRSNYAYFGSAETNKNYPPLPDFSPVFAAAWMG